MHESLTQSAAGRGRYTFLSTNRTVDVPALTDEETLVLLEDLAKLEEGSFGAGKRLYGWFRTHVSHDALDGLSLREKFQEIAAFFSAGETGKLQESRNRSAGNSTGSSPRSGMPTADPSPRIVAGGNS